MLEKIIELERLNTDRQYTSYFIAYLMTTYSITGKEALFVYNELERLDNARYM